MAGGKRILFRVVTEAETTKLKEMNETLKDVIKTAKSIGDLKIDLGIDKDVFSALSGGSAKKAASGLKSVTAEAEDFEAALTKLGRRAEKMESAFGELSGTMRKHLSKGMIDGSRDVETLETSLRTLGSQINKVDSWGKKMKSMPEEYSKALKDQQIALERAGEARRKYNAIIKSGVKDDKALADANRSLKEADVEAARAGRSLEKYTTQMQSLYVEVTQAENAFAKLKSELRGIDIEKEFGKGTVNKIKQLEDAIKSVSLEWGGFLADTRKTQPALANLGNAVKGQISQITKLGRSASESQSMIASTVRELKQEIGSTASEFKKSSNAITQQTVRAADLSNMVGRVTTAMRDWSTVETRIGSIMGTGNREMAERKQHLQALTQITSRMRSEQSRVAGQQDKLTGDLEKYTQALTEVRAKLIAAQTAQAKYSSDAPEYAEWTTKINRLTAAEKNYQDSITKTRSNLDRNKTAYDNISREILEVTTANNRMRASFAAMGSDVGGELFRNLQRMNQIAMQVAQTIGTRLRSSIQTAASAANRLAETAGKAFAMLQRSVQGAGNVFRKFGDHVAQSMERARRSMLEVTAAGYSLMNIGSQINQFGQMMFRNVDRGLRSYMEYERSLIQASIAAAEDPVEIRKQEPGYTGGYRLNPGVIDQMIFDMQRGNPNVTPDWMKAANNGRAIPVTFNATELAQGMYYYSAALGTPITASNSDQVAGTVATIMQLAKVSNTDVETAVKGVMNIALEFGMNPRNMDPANQKDIQKLTAQIGLLSNISTMEVTDIIETFKMVGPMANQLSGGGPRAGLNDTFLMAMLASEVGLRGGNVGRGINQAFTSLLDPTDKMIAVATKYFPEIGASIEGFNAFFKNADGTLKGGITGLLETLASARMNPADQATMLAELFTNNATRALIGSAIGFDKDAAGTLSIQEFLDKMEGDDPLEWLAQASASTANSVSGWFAFMTNAWFQFVNAVSSSVSGPLMGGFRLIGELLFEIAETIRDVPMVGQALTAIVGLVAGIATVGGAALTAVGAMLIMTRTVAALGGFILPTVRLLALLSLSFLTLLPAMFLLATVVGLLAAAWSSNFMGMRMSYERFRKGFNIEDDLRPGVEGFVGHLVTVGTAFKQFITSVLTGTTKEFGALRKVLTSVFGTKLGTDLTASLAVLSRSNMMERIRKNFTDFSDTITNLKGRLAGFRNTWVAFWESVAYGEVSTDTLSRMTQNLKDTFGVITDEVAGPREIGYTMEGPDTSSAGFFDSYVASIEAAGNKTREFASATIVAVAFIGRIWFQLAEQIKANLVGAFTGLGNMGIGDILGNVASGFIIGFASAVALLLGAVERVTAKFAEWANSASGLGAKFQEVTGITLGAADAFKVLGAALGLIVGAKVVLTFGPVIGLLSRMIPLLTTGAAALIGFGAQFVVVAARIAIMTAAMVAQTAVMLVQAGVMAVLNAVKLGQALANSTVAASLWASAAAWMADTAAKVANEFATMGLFGALSALVTAIAASIVSTLGLTMSTLPLAGTFLATAAAVMVLVGGLGILLFAVGAVIAVIAFAVAGFLLFWTAVTQGLGAAIAGIQAFVSGFMAGIAIFLTISSAIAGAVKSVLDFVASLIGAGNSFRLLGVIAGVGVGLMILGITLLSVAMLGLAVTAVAVGVAMAGAWLLAVLPISALMAAIILLGAAIAGIAVALVKHTGWDMFSLRAQISIEKIKMAFQYLWEGIKYGATMAFKGLAMMMDGLINGFVDTITGLYSMVGDRFLPSELEDLREYKSSLADRIELNFDSSGVDATRDKIKELESEIAALEEAKEIDITVGGDAVEETGTIMKMLEKIGLGDTARSTAKELKIDINNASMSDWVEIIKHMATVEGMTEVLQDAGIDITADGESVLGLVGNLGELSNSLGESEDAAAKWAEEWESKVADVKNSLDDLSKMSFSDLADSIFGPSVNANFEDSVLNSNRKDNNRSAISWLMQEGEDGGYSTIMKNLPEGTAPWMNPTEFLADLALGSGTNLGTTGLYGTNMHTLLKDSGALDALSVQTGIPVEVLLEGVPKFVAPDEFQAQAQMDIFSFVSGLDKDTANFLDAQFGGATETSAALEGWTGTLGLNWAEVANYGIGKGIAGHDWNLVDYISDSYGIAREDVEAYLAANNIDPEIVSDAMFPSVEDMIAMQEADMGVFRSENMKNIEKFVKDAKDGWVTMTQDEWNSLSAGEQVMITQGLGYKVELTEDPQQVVDKAIAEIKAANDQLRALSVEIMSQPGTEMIAAGGDGIMTDTIREWTDLGTSINAAGVEVQRFKDKSGTVIEIPVSVLDDYKDQITELEDRLTELEQLKKDVELEVNIKTTLNFIGGLRQNIADSPFGNTLVGMGLDSTLAGLEANLNETLGLDMEIEQTVTMKYTTEGSEEIAQVTQEIEKQVELAAAGVTVVVDVTINPVMNSGSGMDWLQKNPMGDKPMPGNMGGITTNPEYTITIKAVSSNLDETAKALDTMSAAMKSFDSGGMEIGITASTHNLTESARALETMSNAMTSIKSLGDMSINIVAQTSNLDEAAAALNRMSSSLTVLEGVNKSIVISATTSNLSEAAAALDTMAASLTALAGTAMAGGGGLNLTLTTTLIDNGVEGFFDDLNQIKELMGGGTTANFTVTVTISQAEGSLDISSLIDKLVANPSTTFTVMTVGISEATAAMVTLNSEITKAGTTHTVTIITSGIDEAVAAIGVNLYGNITLVAKVHTVTIWTSGISEAIAALQSLKANIDRVARTHTVTLSVVDNASATIGNILGSLAAFKSKTITLTTERVTVGAATGGIIGSAGMAGRKALYTGPDGGLRGQYSGIVGRATGGRVRPSELTLVGEQGPELVALPVGSNVMTARQTASMFRSSQDSLQSNPFAGSGQRNGGTTTINNNVGSGNTINFNGDIIIQNDVDSDRFFDRLDEYGGKKQQLAQRGMYAADSRF